MFIQSKWSIQCVDKKKTRNIVAVFYKVSGPFLSHAQRFCPLYVFWGSPPPPPKKKRGGGCPDPPVSAFGLLIGSYDPVTRPTFLMSDKPNEVSDHEISLIRLPIHNGSTTSPNAPSHEPPTHLTRKQRLEQVRVAMLNPCFCVNDIPVVSC